MTVGGVVLVVAAFSAWSVTFAQMEMLGGVDSRPVGAARGVPTMLAGWITLATGILALVAGPLLALGRGPSATRVTMAALAAFGFTTAVVVLVLGPHLNIAASPDLEALAERLPTGVELETTVATARGPWLTAIGAAIALAGCVGTRER